MSSIIYSQSVKVGLTKFVFTVLSYSFGQNFIFLIGKKILNLISHKKEINNTIEL